MCHHWSRWPCGWLGATLAALAGTTDSVLPHSASPRKDQNSTVKECFLLNAFGFCALTKLKTCDPKHHKPGSCVCTHFLRIYYVASTRSSNVSTVIRRAHSRKKWYTMRIWFIRVRRVDIMRSSSKITMDMLGYAELWKRDLRRPWKRRNGRREGKTWGFRKLPWWRNELEHVSFPSLGPTFLNCRLLIWPG